MATKHGEVIWVSGPVVRAQGIPGAGMLEVVEVGEERIVGEIIELKGETAVIQVYENTGGIKPGDPVYRTEEPLSVELGPGLVGNFFDGVQRPLELLREQTGDFIQRGAQVKALDRKKIWHFVPALHVGGEVRGGEIAGRVKESAVVEHRVLVPPLIHGKVIEVAPEGDYNVETVVAKVDCGGGAIAVVRMFHTWPVRRPRPNARRLNPSMPLVTGQRVIDTFFPIARGGTAAIPGGFGTGKTVTQQNLAKWCDAQIIVYIGCGERGNEMTEVLVEFPHLIDPRSGKSLMERTVLIANTSNMPVAAREASIYTGITIAEYFRDMGYDVALMADSTSRWAEALREISGRLEEMPAEEGFPAYLASRLAEFYERSGRVETLCGEIASISAIGAVSPPGGDFSEPVTQHTLRFVRCFWGLDKEMANARFFPAINYLTSYSEYLEDVEGWWKESGYPQWKEVRQEAMDLLQRDQKLQQIVRLVGEDALPDDQKLVLLGARLIKEGFLQQSAYDPIDMYALPGKQVQMLATLVHFFKQARQAVLERNVPLASILELPQLGELMRMKSKIDNKETFKIAELEKQIDQRLDELGGKNMMM